MRFQTKKHDIMKRNQFFTLVLCVAGLAGCTTSQGPKKVFEPTFESLNQANPVPEWFMDAKFGIYFHWGVYSVPAYANEWYPRSMYIKGTPENRHHIETYGDPAAWPYNNFIAGAPDKQGNFVQFAPKLKSQGGNFDPDEWAQLFADAGARYAGPVAEHHDGFSMWASRVNPWNAKSMGPELDLVGLLTEAIRKKDMKIILSMHHAYNITGFYDAVPQTSDTKFQMLFGQQGKEKNEAFWLNKHKEIIDNYKPDIIWQDFNLHKISQPVLLEFLAYYYNQAAKWNQEVVATYKDGLNTKCAVLDYERGGPSGLTDYYWLTDDAISSSSWSYTEGIGYYSTKQVLHGFIDRISKNGNLLLNISPMADGTIPPKQKEMLLSIGSWLKKYGEAVYATRAWEKYGEGPTRMGAAHGIMGAPVEGTATDIRYTRSKDFTTLYAILMGWEKDQQQVVLTSLSSDRINLENLEKVELINGEAGQYLPLGYRQEKKGLIINLPDKSLDEVAFVIKLSFKGKISALDQYADINCAAHYFMVPGDNPGNLMLGTGMVIADKRKDVANQWKLEQAGKGIYIIRSRKDINKVLTCSSSDTGIYVPSVENFSGADNQYWKIEHAYLGLYRICNKQYPSGYLSVIKPLAAGSKAELDSASAGSPLGWNLKEVCEMKQEAFRLHTLPGTIEAEDFDKGCQEDAFYEVDEVNQGGAYRPNEPVDIEARPAGGYNVGWTKKGEWMAYTVQVKKSAMYLASIDIATNADNVGFHLECDGTDMSGAIAVPNTAGYQNWEVVSKSFQLKAGKHTLKLVLHSDNLNIDKIVFKEIN
jgi:alpha-L-fucosidase